MPVSEGSSDCTRQQDIWGMKTDPFPDASSEEKSGCRRTRSGLKCEASMQTQTIRKREMLPTMLFFLPKQI